MKVFIMVDNFGIGGVQKMAKFIFASLREKNNECTLVSLYKNINSSCSENITQIELCDKSADKITVLMNLRKVVNLHKPDIVCAFGTGVSVYTFIALLGNKTKIIAAERNAPSMMSNKWKIFARIVFPLCDGAVFQLRDAMEFYGLQESNRVKIIENPYLGNIYLEYTVAANRENVIACASARIDRQKGLDTLIRAFQLIIEKYPEYRLHIYGNVKNDHKLKELIDELGVTDKIDFMGETKNLAEVIHNVRIFALPSRFEGIPNALLEVMGSGVPTVSCDCVPGGPKLLTENGKAGVLSGVDNHIEFAEKICLLLENDDLCNAISQEALMVQTKFSSDQISRKWVEYFNNFVNCERING